MTPADSMGAPAVLATLTALGLIWPMRYLWLFPLVVITVMTMAMS